MCVSEAHLHGGCEKGVPQSEVLIHGAVVPLDALNDTHANRPERENEENKLGQDGNYQGKEGGTGGV